MPKIGIILSGCGRFDGSEIHEAVAVLLALDRAGAEAVCMAPAEDQAEVVDHLAGKPAAERRSVLAESARISRGKIRDLSGVKAEELDGLILPGGFGAAKNLSTFAKDGAGCRVQKDVERLLKEMRAAGKPIGAQCIAPAVLARVLGSEHPVLTIGSDPGTAQALESLGARHEPCAAAAVVVDEERRIVTTPAYMLAGRISEVFEGADRLVRKVLALVAEKASTAR